MKTLYGNNIVILQYFSTKFCSYTNVGVLFPTVGGFLLLCNKIVLKFLRSVNSSVAFCLYHVVDVWPPTSSTSHNYFVEKCAI